jgi:hypothetical protein
MHCSLRRQAAGIEILWGRIEPKGAIGTRQDCTRNQRENRKLVPLVKLPLFFD